MCYSTGTPKHFGQNQQPSPMSNIDNRCEVFDVSPHSLHDVEPEVNLYIRPLTASRKSDSS